MTYKPRLTYVHHENPVYHRILDPPAEFLYKLRLLENARTERSAFIPRPIQNSWCIPRTVLRELDYRHSLVAYCLVSLFEWIHE